MAKTDTAELVAAVFSTKEGARKARAALEKLGREMKSVQINRIAIIEKRKDGRLSFSEADKKKGGIWSLAHNAAFIVGSAVSKGATLLPNKWTDETAALAEKLKDSGFPEDALAEIGEGLKDGAAVLITVVDNADEKAIVGRSLAEHGGKLIHKSLSKEVVGRLKEPALAGRTLESVGGLAAGTTAAVVGATSATTGAAKGAAKKVKAVSAGNLIDTAKGATGVATGAAKGATAVATGAAKGATTAATGIARGAAKKVKAVDAGALVDTAKGAAVVATGVAKDAITDPTETAKDLAGLAKSQARKLTGDGGQGGEVKKTVKAATARLPIEGDVVEEVPAAAETRAAEPVTTAVQPATVETETPTAPKKTTRKAARRAPATEQAPAPDDLKQLPDIGPVYEGLLHAHGVTTFAQVARLKAADLRAIFTGVDPQSGLPVVEIDAVQAKAIKAAAREKAAQK